MEPQTAISETSARKGDAVRLVTIALAYFLAHELAFLYPDSQQVLTAIWPAGGIGLAALLLSPRRLWPTITAVLLVTGNTADLLSGRSISASAGFMAANVLESLACAWVISRWCGPEVRFERVRETLALFAVSICVNAATAVLGAGTAALTSTSRFGTSWFNWWVEDGLGILLVTPLIIAWSDFHDLFRGFRWRSMLEAAVLLISLGAAAWLAFQPGNTLNPLALQPYMLIVLFAWSGLRFGQRGVVLALALLATIAVASRGVTVGPLSLGGGTAAERLLAVQIYLALISCMSLLLTAAYAESRAAEARVRVLGDNLPQGAVYQVTLGPDGDRRFLYVSAGVEKLTGVPADEILRDGSAVTNLILEEDRLGMMTAEQAALRNKTVFQGVVRMRRRDGQIRWMNLTSSPRDLGDGRIVWDGIQTDVTERKQAEDDLQKSEARFRTLTEEAPIAISMSREGKIVFANPAYLKMFGFASASELVGQPTLERFAPQSREGTAERAVRRAQGLPVPTEYEAIGSRRDGSEFPMLVGVVQTQFEEGPALVAFITDLTSSKRSEEERAKLEKQLRQAQKLESIGRLAGGIAHDFNNFLTVINGFSAILFRKLSAEDPLRSYAEQIGKAGERGAGLTRQLLAFSRQEVIKPIPVNLNATIADSEQMLLSLVGEHIDLTLRLDASLGQVLVDPAQIDQVILNLVANARDAMPRGGRLEIATRNSDRNEDRNGERGTATNRRWVSVAVTDTGIGMDEATRQNIFEPFFTTKVAGAGTGLGLATVYGVMQQNAGWIDVNSEPGHGSTFTMYFPRIADRTFVPSASANGAHGAHGGETILVVEDQDAVRDFLRLVLEDSGYSVLEADSGTEAVRIAAGYSDEIHLLITDVIMPGMNGKETAERLCHQRPGLKTIFMSGYLADVIAQSGVLDRDVAFLQKPVGAETLAAKVREVLAGSPSAS